MPVMTHSVQIGAYLNPENAQQTAAQLNLKGYSTRIMQIKDSTGRIWYTVRIGAHPNRQAAQAQADEYSRREQKPSVVRPFGRY
jgi:cell division protein FtsN